MLSLRPLMPADFDELCRWFPTEADLVQWGGVMVRFPLDHAQLAAMLALAESTPPAR